MATSETRTVRWALLACCALYLLVAQSSLYSVANCACYVLQRAQARQAKHASSGSQGNILAKREADAKALQDKIARKALLKAEGGDAAANKDKGKNNKPLPQKKK